MKTVLHLFILVSIGASLILSPSPVAAQSPESILTRIESLAAKGTQGDTDLSKVITEQIEAHPEGVAPLLLQKISDPAASESRLATYAWALGWTRDASASEALIALHRRSRSEWVRQNCSQALAMTGSDRAGEYLLSVLDGTSDKDARFDILNLLSEMKYGPALPRMGEVLTEDPKEYYWRSIFVFGKMGDKGVPLLLKKLDDPDRNVRTHVIQILGKWLIDSETIKPLQDHFWVEEDFELRIATLSALEFGMDPVQLKAFFTEVVAKEGNRSVLNFAKETLGSLEEISKAVREFNERNKFSPADFEREYTRLLKSAGKEGDYGVLAASSSPSDEPKLKALREEILKRDSDESFYDYQKVNHIILLNRMAGKTGNRT